MTSRAVPRRVRRVVRFRRGQRQEEVHSRRPAATSGRSSFASREARASRPPAPLPAPNAQSRARFTRDALPERRSRADVRAAALGQFSPSCASATRPSARRPAGARRARVARAARAAAAAARPRARPRVKRAPRARAEPAAARTRQRAAAAAALPRRRATARPPRPRRRPRARARRGRPRRGRRRRAAAAAARAVGRRLFEEIPEYAGTVHDQFDRIVIDRARRGAPDSDTAKACEMLRRALELHRTWSLPARAGPRRVRSARARRATRARARALSRVFASPRVCVCVCVIRRARLACV